jgi:hypothetical protein
LACILRACTTQALAGRGNKRASHYAAELEARAGGEAALSAAGLTPGAPLERRRLSPPFARLESTQILLHLTRHGNEQGPLLFPAHFVACLSLVPGRLPHPRSHTMGAAAGCQRSIAATAGEAKIWLACKRSSQALHAANSVQNKVRPWQPRLPSRAIALGICSAFFAQRGRSPGRMHSRPNKSSSCVFPINRP